MAGALREEASHVIQSLLFHTSSQAPRYAYGKFVVLYLSLLNSTIRGSTAKLCASYYNTVLFSVANKRWSYSTTDVIDYRSGLG